MKNFKLFVLALALFTINVSAANLNPIKPSDDLRIEMIDLIGSTYMDEMFADHHAAEVLFTVNSNHEIIILSVECDNPQIERYLKRKLDYRKVDHKPSKPGEIYLLPVTMVKEI